MSVESRSVCGRRKRGWPRDSDVTPPPRNPAPRRIYVSVDGILYCTHLTELHPNDPTRKRLLWQQMKVGCVYWQDDREHWHKQIVRRRESPEEFGAALWRLACQCGYQQASEKIFAADGGSWCWDIDARYFSDAAGVLDWFHAGEHVWAAARLVAPQSPAEWTHNALDQLSTGGGAALLAWLKPQQRPRRGQPRSALDELHNSVAGQVDHINYPADRSQGWQIGTGMMESTCKQLVGLRLRGPGRHWSEHGALAMTALRATDLNRHWNSFWKSLVLSA